MLTPACCPVRRPRPTATVLHPWGPGGERHAKSVAPATARHVLAQAPVGRHSPDHGQLSQALARERLARASHQDVRGRCLEGGGEIRHLPGAQRRRASSRLHLEYDRRLETAVGEVQPIPPKHGPREAHRLRVAGRGGGGQSRSTREAQAEQLGHLVKGLSHRIVPGLSEQGGGSAALDAVEGRVPAGHDQPDVGDTQVGIGQLRRHEVSQQMVNSHHGQTQAIGQGLAERETHQERAHQPRTHCHRYGVELLRGQIGQIEGLLHGARHRADVVARSQLGNHSAVGAVHLGLSVHDAREDVATRAHDGRRHLVTRTLDSEDMLGHGPRRGRVAHLSRRSRCSWSPLHSMHSLATGRASMRLTPMASPQLSHCP